MDPCSRGFQGSDARCGFRDGAARPRPAGYGYSTASARRAGLELRTFLTRNRVPFEWVDIDADPLARFLLGTLAASDRETEDRLAGVRFPVLLLADGRRLEAPSRLEVARAVGLPTRPTQSEYDLAIVGGGPAGLTAAVYAASEGLRTAVLEREAPGGQAGASARIENYPGSPTASPAWN